jgi:hypothetical protein
VSPSIKPFASIRVTLVLKKAADRNFSRLDFHDREINKVSPNTRSSPREFRVFGVFRGSKKRTQKARRTSIEVAAIQARSAGE